MRGRPAAATTQWPCQTDSGLEADRFVNEEKDAIMIDCYQKEG